MADLDRDRILALSYVPAARRAPVEALWKLDLALGNALAGGREPLISQIKLAWWRESLEKLDRARAPAEPALQSAETLLLTNGVTGTELASMEEGWSVLLTPEVLGEDQLALYAAARGGRLFRYTARLLGAAATAEMESVGEAWALIDLARHSANQPDADSAIAAARQRLHRLRWPSRLRPLGMLGALAARDAAAERSTWEEQGAPPRMLRMLRHRLTGI